MTCCDACLRRAWLLGRLAPYITRALQRRRFVPELLALEDEPLVEAVCGPRGAEGLAFLRSFRAAAARAALEADGLGAVCRHGPGFPAPLRVAPDAPAALFHRGDRALLARLGEPSAAIVGARRCSPYGEDVATALGAGVAGAGTVVVSGMAFGVDSAAHRGALGAGGPTVAVLGGGADVPYPRARAGLYERIVRAGLVVSEMPPGLRPHRWCFPARNRIMAGLTQLTVVVEGRAASGSLITADFARQLGREVGGVPGRVDSPLAAGPNGLIADGALLVRGPGDVLDSLYGPGAEGRPAPPEPPPLEPRLEALLVEMDEGRDSVDLLARDTAHAAELLAAFGELELAGVVRRVPGGRYERRAGGPARPPPAPMLGE